MMLSKLKNNQGFTLVEVVIVVTILAILSIIVAPKISRTVDSKRRNFNILTTLIAETFDDSFIHEKNNFLLIHLSEPLDSKDDDASEVFSRSNGVSVVMRDGKDFKDTDNKFLKKIEFPDSFKIEEVLLSTGEKVTQGNVLVPFYPAGYSDNVIMHILTDDEEKWSVRIFKMRKEPEIYNEYIDFSQI